MREIPPEQIATRIREENPWWEPPHVIDKIARDFRERAYANLLYPLLAQNQVRRAVIMMGPRRVGKTVLIHHMIKRLLEANVPPKHLCYISVDHPLYNGLRLEEIVDAYCRTAVVNRSKSPLYVFLDEIQYVRQWETHLKILVDENPNIRFVASGSSAAALRLKSIESGAGRFTDFLLPPLTFHEYLMLLDRLDLIGTQSSDNFFTAPRIEVLNAEFVRYLNIGGYPEVIFSQQMQSDPHRYIKSDIIDKVLLRDLPSLYGISDVQELNYLFTTLAYNTADEISLEGLSQKSGVAKNTIKRYIEYLEAAFLIRIVHRVDRSAKRFKRANYFKVYLTNPSIRSALFSPMGPDDEGMGHLAETAAYAQWFHSGDTHYYARWPDGEVDMIYMDAEQVHSVTEVKWSDRCVNNSSELTNAVSFCRANDLAEMCATTRSIDGGTKIAGVVVRFIPTSLYCYTVGFNLIRGKEMRGVAGA